MKQYLIHIHISTQIKNKLQQAISDMLTDVNRKVISRHAITAFIMETNKKIATINMLNSRCTPAQPIYLSKWDEDNIRRKGIFDLHFSINDGQFIISLYQLKEEI